MKPSHCIRGHEMTEQNTSLRGGKRSRWACKACHREAARAERLRRLNGEPHRRYPAIDRFLKKVQKTDTCWLWTASGVPKGYGVIFYQGKQQYAHRVSYLLHVGPIPEGMQVLHSCDVPRCVNPEHLSIGTALDNSRNMLSKGRHRTAPACGDKNGARLHPEKMARGESHPHAKLTAAAVADIRARYSAGEKQVAIAAHFKIRQCHVSSIVRHKSWA